MPEPQADVLIVGAGPSGLSLALALARYRLRSIILERRSHPTPPDESRALTIMPAGMRFLDWLGIGADIAAHCELRRFHRFEGGRGGTLLTLDFDRLDSPHRRVFDIPQPLVEQVLESHCRASGLVDLRRGVTVTKVAMQGDGVIAEADGPDGPVQVRAGFGVGADGYHSLVRKALGIGVTKRDYGTHSLVADFETSDALDQSVSRLILDPARPSGFFPFRRDRFRLVLRVNPGETEAQVLGPAFLEGELRRRFGEFADLRLLWASRFRLGQMQSDRYVSGRWVLLGDAAHAMGPSAGSGMQLGLIGAWRLVWRLARAIAGEDPAPLLADYDREHRVTAQAVQTENALIFRNLALRSPMLGRLRNGLLWFVGRTALVPGRMAMTATLEQQTVPTAQSVSGVALRGKRLARYGDWAEGARAPACVLPVLPSALEPQGRDHQIVALTDAGHTALHSDGLVLDLPSLRAADPKAIVAVIRPDRTIEAIFVCGETQS